MLGTKKIGKKNKIGKYLFWQNPFQRKKKQNVKTNNFIREINIGYFIHEINIGYIMGEFVLIFIPQEVYDISHECCYH